MPLTDRIHGLDALRAAALLLGVLIHAALPYLAGDPWSIKEAPSEALANLVFTIHLFRMPLFFLLAGFFGRMLFKRHGLAGFVKDRSRRILVPLVAGWPLIMLLAGSAYVLGAMAVGQSLKGLAPPAAPQSSGVIQSINLMHLWFLYYLLMFYAAALLVRALCNTLSRRSARLRAALETAARNVVRAPWGPVILAVPVIGLWCGLPGGSWAGWPAPFSIIPEVGALLGFGAFFGFGWLLHQQPDALSLVAKRWPGCTAAALVMWFACRQLGATAGGGAHIPYTVCYVLGAWWASLGLLGASLRGLSRNRPALRYLADGSYWIYLMHIPALLFFEQLLHPLHMSWVLKYPLSIAAALAVLLLSYHWLVRFTFIGAILNGRRQKSQRLKDRMAPVLNAAQSG